MPVSWSHGADHWPGGRVKSVLTQSLAGSDSNAPNDAHGFDHSDTERPYAVSRKIHHIARHRRGRLRQEYTRPAILERLEQVAHLPATLDADQRRLYAARVLVLFKAFGHALP